MSKREAREVKPGYYVYEYSDEEIRELAKETPPGLEFLAEYIEPPEPQGPFARLWARLFPRR